MKSFLKYVLATVVGLIVVGVLLTLVYAVSLTALLSQSVQAPTLKDNTVLVVRLSGSLDDRSSSNPLGVLLGEESASLGLDQLVAAIGEAKTNDKVAAIYLEAQGLTAGTASLQELRAALADFRSAGKPIIAYANNYLQGEYFLCSLADSLVLNPQGMLTWRGGIGGGVFFKDALDKLGIEAQIFKVGTYKSAVEPFMLNDMSEANREQLEVYAGESWAQIVGAVGESRGLTAGRVNELADRVMELQPQASYIEEGMIDKLAYTDEVPALIRHTIGLEDEEDYATVTPAELAAVAHSALKSPSGESIVVYYATGNIVDEAPSTNLPGTSYIVGEKVVRDLQELADEEDVKAVVLRVNSPGGSAFASEQIWHAVKAVKAQKPIVVSMGDLAASGGYYISCAADWIIASPGTLTGSIGILGIIPTGEELAEQKLGVHTRVVKTNAHSDYDVPVLLPFVGGLPMAAKPFDDVVAAQLQAYIERGYDLFVSRCAEGRSLSDDSIRAIAEGRVWTGEHALSIGLVDQLGTLGDAIAKAKDLAGIEGDCTLLSYPAEPSLWETLLSLGQEAADSYADARMQQRLGSGYNLFIQMEQLRQCTGIQARLPFFFYSNL